MRATIAVSVAVSFSCATGVEGLGRNVRRGKPGRERFSQNKENMR